MIQVNTRAECHSSSGRSSSIFRQFSSSSFSSVPYVRRSPKRTIIVRLPAGEPITSAGSGAIRTFVFILFHFSAPASPPRARISSLKQRGRFPRSASEKGEIRARYLRAVLHALALNLSCTVLWSKIASRLTRRLDESSPVDKK